MTTQIVIGLGFGDEGKGLATDFLCSQCAPDETLVVRFSGGQQAGHTVVKDGISHISSNYGSGVLRGVDSYISEYCTFYPNTIHNERAALLTKGVNPNLRIHPLAKLTTPYDVAYNRVSQSNLQHGSCGLGIGSTMGRNIKTGHKLFAVDILNTLILKEKLKQIRDYYGRLLDGQAVLSLYHDISKKEEELFFHSIAQNCFSVAHYDSALQFKTNIIFEGSQGVLLDMDHGIFPNVTYANTTSKNAIEICKKHLKEKPSIHYVTRCYQTRHGNGWMSSEKCLGLSLANETNVSNQYQGNFRIGELDYDLLNYSLLVDSIYSGDCEKNLIVTCLDQRPNFKFDANKLKKSFANIYFSCSRESKTIESMQPISEKEKSFS